MYKCTATNTLQSYIVLENIYLSECKPKHSKSIGF